MLSHEKLDALMIASIPNEQRWKALIAQEYAENYIQHHGISWDVAYAKAAAAFSREPINAANDDMPFQQTVMRQDFGGDKKMASAMYILFPLHAGARAIETSLIAKQMNKISLSFRALIGDEVPESNRVEIVEAQCMSRYCRFLERLDVGHEVAKQSARALEASLKSFIFQGQEAATTLSSR